MTEPTAPLPQAPATGGPQIPPGPPSALDRLFAWLRGLGLRRRTQDRWLAGVCSGLADRLGVDPAIVRVAWVLLTMVTGVGTGVYLGAALVLPRVDGRIRLERAVREGHVESIVLLCVTVAVALSELASPVVSWDGDGWHVGQDGVRLLPLLVVGGILVWFLRRSRPASGVTPVAGGWLGEAQGGVAPVPSAHGWSGHGSSGTGSGYRPAAAARPEVGPYPARTPRPSIGWAGLAVAVGIATLAGTAAWLLHGALEWELPRRVAVGTAVVAMLSLAALVVGLAGRRGHGLGLLVCAGILSAFTWVVPVWDADVLQARGDGVTTWRPTSVEQTSWATDSGRAVLDLTALPASELDGRRLSARVDVGALRVVVPEGTAVQVDGTVDTGAIVRKGGVTQGTPGDGEDEAERRSDGTTFWTGVNLDTSVRYGSTSGAPVLTVDAGVDVGTLTIEESAR